MFLHNTVTFKERRVRPNKTKPPFICNSSRLKNEKNSRLNSQHEMLIGQHEVKPVERGLIVGGLTNETSQQSGVKC